MALLTLFFLQDSQIPSILSATSHLYTTATITPQQTRVSLKRKIVPIQPNPAPSFSTVSYTDSYENESLLGLSDVSQQPTAVQPPSVDDTSTIPNFADDGIDQETRAGSVVCGSRPTMGTTSRVCPVLGSVSSNPNQSKSEARFVYCEEPGFDQEFVKSEANRI